MTVAERDAKVRRHIPLVKSVAKRVARVISAADLGDLIGDGCVGLIRAVDSYDTQRGTTFDTYARRVILGAMLNGMRRADPVSERVRRLIRAAEKKRFAEANATGRMPSFAELERRDPALRRARVSAYWHTPLSIDAPLALASSTVADCSNEPAAVTQRRASRREIAEAVALLPERERRILSMHYAGEASLEAIGAELRVSPQRISQLHLRAIRTLRATLPANSDYR